MDEEIFEYLHQLQNLRASVSGLAGMQINYQISIVDKTIYLPMEEIKNLLESIENKSFNPFDAEENEELYPSIIFYVSDKK